MDEYNQGMDPQVKIYFKKIMNSFAVGLLWMLVAGTLGLFFKLAIINKGWHWYNVLFYLFFFATLTCLLFYFHRIWRKK